MKKGTQALSLCSWGYVWGWGYQDGLEEVTDGHRGVRGAGGDLSGLGEGPDGLGSIQGARGDQDALGRSPTAKEASQTCKNTVIDLGVYIFTP